MVSADTTKNTLPLTSELLKQPINLDCGAVIREWRGSEINESKVNKVCSRALSEFEPFVRNFGYSPSIKPFNYSISFIPYGTNFRDLNDIKHRFAGRNLGTNVTGYTVHEDGYIFNISDINDPDFEVSLMHELFHGMSYYYGVFGQHSGSKTDKIMKDEKLAKIFTKKIIGRE